LSKVLFSLCAVSSVLGLSAYAAGPAGQGPAQRSGWGGGAPIAPRYSVQPAPADQTPLVDGYVERGLETAPMGRVDVPATSIGLEGVRGGEVGKESYLGGAIRESYIETPNGDTLEVYTGRNGNKIFVTNGEVTRVIPAEPAGVPGQSLDGATWYRAGAPFGAPAAPARSNPPGFNPFLGNQPGFNPQGFGNPGVNEGAVFLASKTPGSRIFDNQTGMFFTVLGSQRTQAGAIVSYLQDDNGKTYYTFDGNNLVPIAGSQTTAPALGTPMGGFGGPVIGPLGPVAPLAPKAYYNYQEAAGY